MRPRLRALRAALGIGLALAAALGVTRPATATDLPTLRSRAQKLADQVSRLEHRLSGLRDEASSLETEISAVNRDLGTLGLDLEAAEQELAGVQERFVARAVEAYKSSPSTQLAMILSAKSLAEMTSLAEITSGIARSESESIDELVDARAAAEAARESIDARKQRLLAARAEAAAVEGAIEGALAERQGSLSELNDEIASLEEQARAAAERMAARRSIPTSQALLDILGASGPSRGIPTGFVGTGVRFEGIASWYGPGFEGNHTANGDIFDSSLFTAASKELPLGSWLYVEHEGRGVVVYVNDRGPYVDDRILDLSQAAAEEIGITGLGWIEAEIILETD